MESEVSIEGVSLVCTAWRWGWVVEKTLVMVMNVMRLLHNVDASLLDAS